MTRREGGRKWHVIGAREGNYEYERCGGLVFLRRLYSNLHSGKVLAINKSTKKTLGVLRYLLEGACI